eukprot:TRINITY_DN62101_c0_g1_i1.p2 TRINITY_DN62101_c0_g1~~TRINITY_DN62101_c0_g1_i1.p2  ORF type:complete len:124 (+),score=14.20 TRINITY_DN62101_c0_g1_i1:528-899(+)
MIGRLRAKRSAMGKKSLLWCDEVKRVDIRAIPEEVDEAKELYAYADKRPSNKHDENTGEEACSSFPLAPLEEEEERLLCTDHQCDTRDEKDVAHCQQGSVEEQQDTKEEEEQSKTGKSEPYFP